MLVLAHCQSYHYLYSTIDLSCQFVHDVLELTLDEANGDQNYYGEGDALLTRIIIVG